MADLIARPPCKGLLPLEIGDGVLREIDGGKLTSIAPFKGQAARVAALLKAAVGADFPKPNRTTGKAGQSVIWFARNQAMLIGPEPDPKLADHAALTDQSDAWAIVELAGPSAEDVLARLAPVDLRNSVFRRGHTVRTQLMHLNVSITRTGADTFQIMAFRSMAKTLVHDLRSAMEGVAARG